MNTDTTEAGDGGADLDIVIVGAGWAGMYMLIKARELGLRSTLIEAGEDVGGTWYWNRYPGARCDVPSVEYSYSFSEELQQEWTWSEKYATQPEIQRYARFVADKFDLWRDIRFNTRIASAIFDASANLWRLSTADGDSLAARYCVMATGPLSAAKLPEIAGLDAFRGETYHTGQWPHGDVDLTGKRVGVIGTGSSGIQVIPVVAEMAEHLYVFQRTPNYSVPARNAPHTLEEMERVKRDYGNIRRKARETFNGTVRPGGTRSALEVSDEERDATYQTRWTEGGAGFVGVFNDLITNADANETASDFVRRKIGETVNDPDIAEKLMPRGYYIGTKRLCVDSGYFETFNRENVTLVDLQNEPIDAITRNGVRTMSRDIELDALVFATGFDALTGALTRIDIRGREGARLAERWADGPTNYLGYAVAGFPNMFMISGPGSPAALSNVIVCIEDQVEWVARCLEFLEAHRVATIEPTIEAEQDWVAHVNDVADRTLYPRTNSWYVGANVPGKPRVFMPYIGGLNVYRDICRQVERKGYEGFCLRGDDGRQAEKLLEQSTS